MTRKIEMAGTIADRVQAARAWLWYWRRKAYRGALPCLQCVWWHDSRDPEAPWQWITCECEWGNR